MKTGPTPTDAWRARALVRLYPQPWRSRYGAEYLALLADSGTSAAVLFDGLRGAIDAWLTPSGETPAEARRLRASVSGVWCAWIAVVGLAAVFAQLTSDQPFQAANAGHALLGVIHALLIISAFGSTLAVAVGGGPLFWSLWRAARLRRDRGGAALLAAPVLAPAAFVVVAALVSRAVGHSRVPGVGIGALWFVVVVALGVLAGTVGAFGPVRALGRLTPSANTLRLAARAGAATAGAAVAIGLASTAYALVLGSQAPRIGSVVTGPTFLVPYVCLMAVACGVAVLSAARGMRALRSTAA